MAKAKRKAADGEPQPEKTTLDPWALSMMQKRLMDGINWWKAVKHG